MTALILKDNEYLELDSIFRSCSDAQIYSRALAILQLADGETVEEVATFLRVSRQTIYNVASRFQARAGMPMEKRLLNSERSGRPATARSVITEVAQEVMETDPRLHGYTQTVWTAELLQRHIKAKHGVDVGLRSIQITLDSLDYLWKRPRHTLSRRDPHWRQAKGG